MRAVASTAAAAGLGDGLLDGAAGGELHDGEVDGDDAEEGGDQQQEPAEDVGAHGSGRAVVEVTGDVAVAFDDVENLQRAGAINEQDDVAPVREAATVGAQVGAGAAQRSGAARPVCGIAAARTLRRPEQP